VWFDSHAGIALSTNLDFRRNAMLKRIISTLITLVIALTPLLLAGCEKNEIRTHKEVEVKEQVIHQDTVVQ
jgi:ABC-type oligopeptide transport system substrate-binding subunit